jgi:hypothetical protein
MAALSAATLQRLNPGADAFMARLLSFMGLREELPPPLRSHRRFPSPQPRVAGQTWIEEGHDDTGAAISDSETVSDAETEETDSDDEIGKKHPARPRRVRKVVPPHIRDARNANGRGRRPAPTISTSKSIAVHCDSYVPQSDLPQMPRFIFENLKTESTLAKGNSNVKNLYDALHLLTKGETDRVLNHYKKFRAGRSGVDMTKCWGAYNKTTTSLPTCDFYILVRRDADPLKSVFLKMTLPFWRMKPNNCLLPKELLRELGATFLIASGSDTTKMTFTDVTVGSPGYGFKFKIPVCDASGSSDDHVTFAFMVELSILKDGTDDEFVPAPLLPTFAIPDIASSATDLVEHVVEHNPSLLPPPSLPLPSAPAIDPPAIDPPAIDPPAASALPLDPPPLDPPAASALPLDPPPLDPPPLDPPPLETELPNRAEPPTPINEKDFWSLAPNYPLIRNKVFAHLRTTIGAVLIDNATCTALDNAYQMLFKSGTRYTEDQMVVEIVAQMKIELKW